jgi:carbonic anhydrase/acetyltransferase-like protein (isoleucine patch superfamily)
MNSRFMQYQSDQLVSCRGITPQLGKDVFLARGAYVIGDVIVGVQSSIWFNAVLRGDVTPIRVGERTNIQDGAVLHGTFQKADLTIGNDVTVGHTAVLHGCTIGDLVLIGMGSIIMDLAKIGSKSIVGAGSLVTEGSEFPDGSLILGRPAKVIRPLKPEELAFLPKSSENYQLYQSWY